MATGTKEAAYVVGDRVRYRGASAGTQQRAGDRIGVVQSVAIRPGPASQWHAATARVAWSDRADDWNHVLLSELVRADGMPDRGAAAGSSSPERSPTAFGDVP